MRRALATVLTLGLLSSFLLAVILGIMVVLGVVSPLVAGGLVVLINVVLLLVSPTINDIVYRWLYDLEWVSPDEFRARTPAGWAAIDEVTSEFDYATPKLGIIPDRNPTAFTYGSGRFNGRIVLTEGCFEYLDDDEVAAVVAHELGHITSRDFIVMTLANTIVQLLYILAATAWRVAATGSGGGRDGRGRGLLFGVALLAYLLWFLGEYMVLYLSRVREYAADAFGAAYTHPDALSSALVKIAYGIVMSEDSPELAKATRNIGIMNVNASKTEGLLYHNAQQAGGDADLLERSFLFDLHNPWARVIELKSTHPLTGKRVRSLSTMAGAERYDFDAIERRFTVDHGRLRRTFLHDLGVLAAPSMLAVGFPLGYLGAVAAGLIGLSWAVLIGGWLVVVGVAILARTRYKYPRDRAEATTVVDLLGDVYASPVRGRMATLDGELIGRGRAGYRFSADLMFQDETGLMYLNYDHWLPGLGNLLFAVRRVPDLIGQRVAVDGWYLRGVSPWLGLRRLETADDSIRGFIDLGGYVIGGLVAAIGVIVLAVAMVL